MLWAKVMGQCSLIICKALWKLLSWNVCITDLLSEKRDFCLTSQCNKFISMSLSFISIISPNCRWKIFEYSLNLVTKKNTFPCCLRWIKLFKFKSIQSIVRVLPTRQGFELCPIIMFRKTFCDPILICEETWVARK